MDIRHQLTFLCQFGKCYLLKHTSITSKIIKHLWFEYHITCVDRRTIRGIFFTERFNGTILNIKHTLILCHFYGC